MREEGAHRRIERFLSHDNILKFCKIFHPDVFSASISNILSDPENVLRTLCQFLGLDFEDAMLRPYEDRQHRMTDGLRRRAMGDKD